jgi:ubiquitin carboxyl-terminal hydrolase 9/24
MPAVVFCNPDETKQFQESVILAGGVNCFNNMLTSPTLLARADDNTKKACLLYILKLNKLTMTTVCYAIYSHVVTALTTKQFSQVNEALHNHALLLQNSTGAIPSSTTEITLKGLAQRLGSQFSATLLTNLPDLTHIARLERIAWSLAANATLQLADSPHEAIHEALIANKANDAFADSPEDICVYREAFECLSLALCLVPKALETLNQEKHWRTFIVDLVLQCGSRFVRQIASEQMLLIALKCSQNINRPLQFLIQMLFTCLHVLGKENGQQSQEYFYLLCRLLNCANVNNVQISNTETLLNNEVLWLKRVKQVAIAEADTTSGLGESGSGGGGGGVDEMLLDGHLGITKELLLFQTSEKKCGVGSKSDGPGLIYDLVEYFIFPASFLFKKYRDSLVASASKEQQSVSFYY